MSSIWFATPDIALMNRQMQNTACSNLGIEITEIGDDWVKGTMPADERTFQPVGLVHGGANVLFAETLGSMAANLCLDNSKEYAVGQEINANHLRGVRSGTNRSNGRASQVWDSHRQANSLHFPFNHGGVPARGIRLGIGPRGNLR